MNQRGKHYKVHHQTWIHKLFINDLIKEVFKSSWYYYWIENVLNGLKVQYVKISDRFLLTFILNIPLYTC